MKLGEMLVRDGRLSEENLQEAIKRQASDGGRLGTVLVEMGLLDIASLTVYLGLELGIPIATGATLERAKKTAVKLLSPQQALRYRCVPIVIQHRQLIAAIDDPHDLHALDELSQITSYRVIPRVAPEVRIYYYLERYYGVPRPARFVKLGDSPRGKTKSAGDAESNLPAPPLPGLPPESSHPIAAPTPVPVLRTDAPVSTKLETLEVDAADLVEVLDADLDEIAEEQPKQAAPPRTIPSDRASAKKKVAALSASEALEKISKAKK